jgi:heptaprenylglyceryl phosphate synthase
MIVCGIVLLIVVGGFIRTETGFRILTEAGSDNICIGNWVPNTTRAELSFLEDVIKSLGLWMDCSRSFYLVVLARSL